MQVEMLQGQGSFDFPDGAHYEGEFDTGQMHGQGTFSWPSGELYQGEFLNGKRQGQGRYLTGTADFHEALFPGKLFHKFLVTGVGIGIQQANSQGLYPGEHITVPAEEAFEV